MPSTTKAMTRTIKTLPLVLLAVAMAGGCRNPFNPSADIELAEITCSNKDTSSNDNKVQVTRPSLWINCTYLKTLSTIDYTQYTATMNFVVKNKVIVTIRRISMVYTDPLGNEITLYKNVSGGRTFSTLYRFSFPANNNSGSGSYGEGVANSIELYPIDSKVYETIKAYPYDTMYVTITAYGDDENGYDVRLSGTVTITFFGECNK